MIQITADWGRIGPIWWMNSDTRGVRSEASGRRYIYWGRFSLTSKLPLKITWLKG